MKEIIPNKVLSQLKNNKVSLGAWILSGSEVVAELFAMSGFDWVCIDAEHSAVTTHTAQSMMMAIEKHGAEPFVRVSQNDESECKKFLDMGARGILIPMIKSHEDVLKAIHYTRFPPIGKRSYSLSRSTYYGEGSSSYFKKANETVLLGIMIEHQDALTELDRIFSEQEIDVVLIGPYDLSGSLGIPGEFNKPEYLEAMDLINRKAREYKINVGLHEVHPTPEKIQQKINDGYTFIACGMDTIFLIEEAKKYTNLKI